MKDVTKELQELDPGDEVQLKIKIFKGPHHSGEEQTLNLRVRDSPSSPSTGVINLWDAEVDFSNMDPKQALEEGYRNVNIQPARRHSSAGERGYQYEIRDLMSHDIDGAAVQDVEIAN